MTTPGWMLAKGEIIDGVFEVIQQIGIGGTGEVYEALDRRLGRRVALKIARPNVGRILEAEARTLAALRHPAIIQIFHGGTHHDLDYFAMELIEGGSLQDRLDRHGRLEIAACLDLLDAITDALGYLHHHRLVHRDLKPANVMLGGGDRVVLLDFGIVMQERGAAEVKEIAGTIQYIAPEALRGDLEIGDAHLVDLYALGILGYQLLTNKVPFDDPSVMAVAHQHLGQVAPRPSAVRPDVPPRLDHLIAALLSKQPAERPPSMSVVRDQLRAVRRAFEQGQLGPPPVSVLVVDDDPDMLALMRACIHQASPLTTIVTARSIADASTRLNGSSAFDVIFLDLMLGDGSGVDLLMDTGLLARFPDTRVVVVSSHDQSINRELVSQLGVDAFITKNAGLLELEDAVCDQLFRKRRRIGSTRDSRPPPGDTPPRLGNRRELLGARDSRDPKPTTRDPLQRPADLRNPKPPTRDPLRRSGDTRDPKRGRSPR